MLREIGGTAYDEASFAEAKTLTGHSCAFCASFARLQDDRLDQAMHNMIVIRDTVEVLNTGVDALPVAIRAVIEGSRYQRLRTARA
jgi:hypothetical protein